VTTEGSDLIQAALDECRERMHKAVDHARADFATVRTGRASPALIEKLRVDYYGTEVPLQQVAGFSVPEPRVLVVSPYDKGALKAIEKAISSSDLGINPSNDGTVIRLVFPELTTERRKELVKVVRHRAEDGRVAVRNVRRATRHDLDALEKDGDISSDELERAEKDLEKVTHESITQIEQLLATKEKELLEL
jgi:ribosome recycling factor